MYQKLPFDKPETITKLGAKLFTRIKNEDQQRVIREFSRNSPRALTASERGERCREQKRQSAGPYEVLGGHR